MAQYQIEAYKGSEKYIFVSYAHKDSEQVFPIMKMLKSRGYRIWYDEGIVPGSEWTDHIAKRLNNSIAEFARVPNFDATDRLAMAALRYSMMLLNTQQSSSLGDGDIEELHAIEERIRAYIK